MGIHTLYSTHFIRLFFCYLSLSISVYFALFHPLVWLYSNSCSISSLPSPRAGKKTLLGSSDIPFYAIGSYYFRLGIYMDYVISKLQYNAKNATFTLTKEFS